MSLPYIADTLHKLVNVSFNEGVLPDKLKIARVIPIFKDGEEDIFLNYRPISIIPSISKILKNFFYNRLLSYLDKSNILCKNQYGFRRNHSTFMAMLEFTIKYQMHLITNNFQLEYLLICRRLSNPLIMKFIT